MAARVRIELKTWNLADAKVVIAIEALKHKHSIDAAAKAMNITPNALRRIMDANDIPEPVPPVKRREAVRRKDPGRARKG